MNPPAKNPRPVLGLLVQPDGTAEVVTVDFSAGTLKNILGGYAEGIAVPDGDWVCYVDEDGKVYDPPLEDNPLATAIVRALGWRGFDDDRLCGRALFLGKFAGEEIDVPPRVVAAAGSFGVEVKIGVPLGRYGKAAGA